MKKSNNKNNYSNTTTYKIDCKEKEYLYIKESQLLNSGKGLFSAIDIYKNEIISIFKGEILDPIEAQKRAETGKDGYFINLINGEIMDSINTTCFAKYANDAAGASQLTFKNNANISLDENDTVCIVASRNIKAREEIFCNYGKAYWAKFQL